MNNNYLKIIAWGIQAQNLHSRITTYQNKSTLWATTTRMLMFYS